MSFLFSLLEEFEKNWYRIFVCLVEFACEAIWSWTVVCSEFFIYFILFIYFWLHWVFVAAHGLSLVVASGGYSSLRCAGFSLRWLLLLRGTGSRRVGFSSCSTQALGVRASVVVVHGLSCSAACGIFPDQGLNPCPPHWQADS